MNSLIWIIADSCRYDSMIAAHAPHLKRFAQMNETCVQRRYSYASWTAPSHFAFLMGMVPHSSPRGVIASDVYKEEFADWSARLGITDMEFSSFIPHLSLVKVLKGLGYRTVGRVSLPVLNESTLVA